LPGIATDLLTARLRTLGSAGFVTRRELPRPARATVYELTDAGQGLGPLTLALGQVGLRLFGAPAASEAVRAEPVVLSLRLSFRRGAYPDLAEAYQLVIDDEPSTVEVADGRVMTLPGTSPTPALTLRASAHTLVALLRRDHTVKSALADGALDIEGDRKMLNRFLAAFAYPPGL
jgi:HxlR-like helix-turn-helix/SCP-2 sterol transfer family